VDRTQEWAPVRASISASRLRVQALRDIAVAALGLLIITSLPYIYGYLSAPSGKWFSGIIYNVHDTAQYLSWMRESGTHFFIENKLTSEPNPAIFVNLHWWIPGRTAALLGLSLPEVYQFFRVLSVLLYVGAAYWLCGLFFPEPQRQRFAFWLTTLGSGLGWIWVVDKYANRLADLRWPHDVYTTPGNSFWVLLASPHLTLALALVLLILGLAWLGYRRQQLGVSLAAGGLALFLGLGHVYDLVTVWAILGVLGLLLTLRDGFRWRTFLSLGVVVLISSPAPLYFGWVSSSANPLWQQALAQYDNLGAFTPSPLHLLVLLGIPLVLAAGGFVLRLGPLATRSDRDLMLCGWFVTQLVIVYLPLRFQVMLLTGAQFVLAALATDLVFERLMPWIQERVVRRGESRWLGKVALRRWLPVLVVLAVLPSNAYLLAWRFVDLHRYGHPFFLDQDERAALHWLEENAQADEVVLSALETGHYIPGLAGTHAFLSSAVMTIDYQQKAAAVAQFFDAGTPQQVRRDLLRDGGIDYIFYGAAERVLGTFDPGSADYLSLAFEAEQASIYRVLPAALAGVQ
jgi:hypothetical protein